MAKVQITEDEFPGNSESARVAPLRSGKRSRREAPVVITEPKKKFKTPVSGMVMKKKRSFTQNIAEALVGDGSQNVVGYILSEVLIPTAKTMIQEAITSGLEMVLFGEATGRSRKKDKNRSTVSYGSYYQRAERDDRPSRRHVSVRDRFNLSEIYFRHGDVATDILEQLSDALEEYNEVSVGDFFDAAGIDGATWAHYKFGWTDLEEARCTHTRHGYQIMFPDPIELD